MAAGRPRSGRLGGRRGPGGLRGCTSAGACQRAPSWGRMAHHGDGGLGEMWRETVLDQVEVGPVAA